MRGSFVYAVTRRSSLICQRRVCDSYGMILSLIDLWANVNTRWTIFLLPVRWASYFIKGAVMVLGTAGYVVEWGKVLLYHL